MKMIHNKVLKYVINYKYYFWWSVVKKPTYRIGSQSFTKGNIHLNQSI